MGAQLYCGTSGFAYATWKPGFYPEKLSAKKFLSHYASRLNAVEINYTFRSLPSAKTLESWMAETPASFRFAMKGHQRISHIEKLNATDFSRSFFESLSPLAAGGKLGPILFQLPATFRVDVDRLSEFLAAAPRSLRIAFEFRSDTWFIDPVWEILRKHGAALCLAESDKLETPPVITADFVYARLRKTEYGPADLAEISTQADGFLKDGKDVFLFFKHEDTPEGALNAERLLTGRRD